MNLVYPLHKVSVMLDSFAIVDRSFNKTSLVYTVLALQLDRVCTNVLLINGGVVFH